MSKKWDEKLSSPTVIVIKQSTDEEKLALPIETKTTTNSNSLIVPLEDYVRTISPDYAQLSKEYRLGSFPDLFEIRGLENDKESTVPALAVSRPVKVFTALYEAKFKSILEEEKKKIPN